MITNILPLLPIMLPFFSGVLMLAIGKNVVKHRVIASITAILLMLSSLWQLLYVHQNGMLITYIGGWEPPFGISLAIDMASALLIFTTSIITFAVVVYSFQSIRYAREKFFYYVLVMFMITGINGAFSTGDIFNMFVFFEVFLIASYILIILGGTQAQIKEGLKYFIANLISSNLFVLALALLYSVVGTLNMADIYMKLSNYEGDATIMSIIAILFLVVFATKAGVFPLYFWLPNSYYAPPVPIIALFGALLTKVGIYAIARTYSLFFLNNVEFTHQFLLLLALLTIIFGSIGALAYTDLKKVIIYNIMIAVGVILVGFAMMNESGALGAMYYLIHDMIIKGALFLLVGFIIIRTGVKDSRHLGGLIQSHPLMGLAFFIAALSLAGVPPLSGFYGKLFIVKSTIESDHLISGIIVLLSSLVVVYSIIRLFIQVFWGEANPEVELKNVKLDKIKFGALFLVVVAILFGLGADYLYPFMEQAAQSFYDPATYSSYITGGD